MGKFVERAGVRAAGSSGRTMREESGRQAAMRIEIEPNAALPKLTQGI